jgi:hypothetical protein
MLYYKQKSQTIAGQSDMITTHTCTRKHAERLSECVLSCRRKMHYQLLTCSGN